jgi:hypothetical protein
MQPTLSRIAEYAGCDDETIRREIIPRCRPAVLKGLVKDWPAVQHGSRSAQACAGYLRQFDNGRPVDAIMTPPEALGRIFYNDDMSGFNFVRNRLPVSAVLEQVLRYSVFPKPPAVAVQSALIADCLPGFAAENRLSVLDESIPPRIWIGNAITTPAHFDEWNNIGCVVSGRRRFTLFPPEQIANLYIGPLDYAPTGAPMSLVSLRNPDFERFPRFRQALDAAQSAELEPGDALFIPPVWWHHVESLERFNILVNYWWQGSTAADVHSDSALECLMHCLLNLRQLAPETRAAWAAIFSYYIFDADSGVTDHIPEHKRGVLGALSPELTRRIRAQLVSKLQR